MLTINKFPRCQGYLKAMWVKPPYHGMNDYWCAVLVADAFSDEYLADAGTINFETMSGSQLLAALERLLEKRSKGHVATRKSKSRRGAQKVMAIHSITAAVSDDEIKAAMTPKGGWKAATLAGWGISWPPPRGWREKLIENHKTSSN